MRTLCCGRTVMGTIVVLWFCCIVRVGVNVRIVCGGECVYVCVFVSTFVGLRYTTHTTKMNILHVTQKM